MVGAVRPGDPLRVLLTNITLASRTGTETYTRDLALGLLRAGHCPAVYTTDRGAMAGEIERAGVPVVDRIGTLPFTPDVIHGHHHPGTMTALAHFPDIPAIFVCHDASAWHDQPPRFPRIRRYVAVDEACHDRLVLEHGLPEHSVTMSQSWVDVDRFQPRDPLPGRPRRALVFSNYATEDVFLDVLRAACARADVALDVAGAGVASETTEPEALLRRYDLVFAKARCALEALAVGAAVVVGDALWGLGPLVTPANLDRLRRLNFGRRSMVQPVTVDGVLQRLRLYDAAQCAEVSRRVRSTASLTVALAELVALYRQVIAEQAAAPRAPEADGQAIATYLRELFPYETLRALHGQLRELDERHQALWQQYQHLARERCELSRHRRELEGQHRRACTERDRALSQAAASQQEAEALRRSLTWRLYRQVRRIPFADPCLRLLARWLPPRSA